MKILPISTRCLTIAACLILCICCSQKKGEVEAIVQPNIIWIVSEDNSPFLDCYGDEFATTPSLDELASEGVLYENAFANAPVCAPARSTIITGMYPPSMGTQNMRSVYPIPEFIKFFPQYLRGTGYYCTNNSKTDYNMATPEGTWDESSKTAHYKNRKEGQPFFAVFNIGISHESSIHKSIPNDQLRHDPAKVILPPYHPDTPEMRHDWAQYYDKVEDMDTRVGELLKELEDAGLAENTIVAYYGDHGGVLARSKRFVYESGTRVPMIWRFPKKYQNLAPGANGSKIDRLVSFVDLAPTILSLTGIEIPEYMQGSAFLGDQQEKPRDYVHLFRGRMDERMDKVRAVRDKQYRYIKNYMPHRIYGQYIEYLWRAPSCRSWEAAYKAGKCNAEQSAFWEQKPPEELYDVVADPWEVNNLADDPQYAEVLARLRAENDRWMMEIKDTGLMPEGYMTTLNKEEPSFNYAHSSGYEFAKIKHAADVATLRKPENLNEIIEFTHDENPIVRYWGATGCLVLGKDAGRAKKDLSDLLNDPIPDVRIAAAEELCHLGSSDLATPVLVEALSVDNVMVRVHALNSLEIVGGPVAKAAIPKAQAMIAAADPKNRNYDIRAARRLVEVFGK